MPKFIRRSLLLVDMANMSLSEDVLGAKSDALILDWETMPLERQSTVAGSDMLSVLSAARKHAAEPFVRLRHDTVHKGLETAVWPGLVGVFLTNVEHAEEVEEASKHLAELERHRGIPMDSLQIIVEIGTAMGVWNSLDIARGSARLAGLSVGETSLCRDLHLDIEARLDRDPLRFIKAQIIVNARAAGIEAQGMSYPLSITLEQAANSALDRA
ncbi:MAG: aldolase/citrate lyase family protein, partial [bacterium]